VITRSTTGLALSLATSFVAASEVLAAFDAFARRQKARVGSG